MGCVVRRHQASARHPIPEQRQAGPTGRELALHIHRHRLGTREAAHRATGTGLPSRSVPQRPRRHPTVHDNASIAGHGPTNGLPESHRVLANSGPVCSMPNLTDADGYGQTGVGAVRRLGDSMGKAQVKARA